MRFTIHILTLALLLSCGKGDNFCEPPSTLNGFLPITQNNDPAKGVLVKLDYEVLYNKDQEKTLFSFSTPDVFINPKGDFPTDVSKENSYIYYLKDTLNPPASIEICAYAFNDCGKSVVKCTNITYDTIP